MAVENHSKTKEMLGNRIYTTKKIRMNLEERLVVTNSFFQMLIVYYSLVVAGFSMLALIKSVDWINYVLVLSSISITVLSVYLSSQNYIQRANDIKNNYTKIAELEIQIELLVDDELTDTNLNRINCEYQELLRQVENHRKIDYEHTLKKKPKIFYFRLLRVYLMKLISVTLPLLALFLYLWEVYSTC